MNIHYVLCRMYPDAPEDSWKVASNEYTNYVPALVWFDEALLGPRPTLEEMEAVWYVMQLEEGVSAATSAIHAALDSALSTYTTYPVSEVDGWDALYREAQEWQDSGGTVVGPILTAYAANIGTVDGQPDDTLPDYCAVVIAKHLSWCAKYGQELAIRRTRSKTLEAIVAGISATPPTHTLEDLATFTAGISS